MILLLCFSILILASFRLFFLLSYRLIPLPPASFRDPLSWTHLWFGGQRVVRYGYYCKIWLDRTTEVGNG